VAKKVMGLRRDPMSDVDRNEGDEQATTSTKNNSDFGYDITETKTQQYELISEVTTVQSPHRQHEITLYRRKPSPVSRPRIYHLIFP